MPLSRATLLSLAALALAGCLAGGSEPEDPGVPASLGRADGWDEPAPDVPTLAARYALLLESEVVMIDAEGELSTLLTRFVGLAATTQRGGAVDLSIRPCRVDLPPADGTRMFIPPGLLDRLDPVETPAYAYYDDDHPCLATAPAAVLLGLDLDDPLEGAVPERGDDPSVVDLDDDGNPGVSLVAGWWRIYASARVVFDIAGAIDSSGRIPGMASLSLDYAIYGDNVPFYDARTAAAEADAAHHLVARDDRFLLIPVDGAPDIRSCAALLASGLADPADG